MKRYYVVKTEDGSYTVYDTLFDEPFHSLNGAITESYHVFIKNGLFCYRKKSINILEIGFGTGLNCLLTFIYRIPGQEIFYDGIDKFPLPKEINKELKLHDKFEEHNTVYDKIKNCEWDVPVKFSKYFTLTKFSCSLRDFESPGKYDIIYFDAFSPGSHPEIWAGRVFEKIARLTLKSGIFLTYSSSGLVKTGLRNNGFKVSRLEGPPGKRHVLRAVKSG